MSKTPAIPVRSSGYTEEEIKQLEVRVRDLLSVGDYWLDGIEKGIDDELIFGCESYIAQVDRLIAEAGEVRAQQEAPFLEKLDQIATAYIQLTRPLRDMKALILAKTGRYKKEKRDKDFVEKFNKGIRWKTSSHVPTWDTTKTEEKEP